MRFNYFYKLVEAYSTRLRGESGASKQRPQLELCTYIGQQISAGHGEYFRGGAASSRVTMHYARRGARKPFRGFTTQKAKCNAHIQGSKKQFEKRKQYTKAESKRRSTTAGFEPAPPKRIDIETALRPFESITLTARSCCHIRYQKVLISKLIIF